MIGTMTGPVDMFLMTLFLAFAAGWFYLKSERLKKALNDATDEVVHESRVRAEKVLRSAYEQADRIIAAAHLDAREKAYDPLNKILESGKAPDAKMLNDLMGDSTTL